MQIMIKTQTEFHDSHVTIEITADGQAEIETVAATLDPGTLGRLAGQEDRIADLEAELAEALRGRNTNREWAKQVEARLGTATRQLVNVAHVVAADRPYLRGALNTHAVSTYAAIMQKTIVDIQELVAPWADRSSAEPTSQA